MSEIDSECDRINKLQESSPPHIVLGINIDSDKITQQKAYRKLSLKCHPDRPKNTDKELFKSIFQKIVDANEKFKSSTSTQRVDTTTSEHTQSRVSKSTSDLENRKVFGPIGPEIDEYIKYLKDWLEEYLKNCEFDIPYCPLEDVQFLLKYLNDNIRYDYRNYLAIRPLYDEIYTKAIWNVLRNSNEVNKPETQKWILSIIADYISTPKSIFSQEYYNIIMSKELNKILTDNSSILKNEPKTDNEYTYKKIIQRIIEWINERKMILKKNQEDQENKKLAIEKGDTRIAELRTMVDTFITSNRTEPNEESLDKFIEANIKPIFKFLSNEQKIEIKKIIIRGKSPQKGGGFSVRSNRKQSKRRLRKTRHRRKKITKKSKQV